MTFSCFPYFVHVNRWMAIGELVRNGASDLWLGRTHTYYVVHIEVWSSHTPYTLVLIRVRVGAFPRHHWQGLNFAKRRCKIYQPKPPSLSLPYLHPPCFIFHFCSCSCPCSSVFSHCHRFLPHLMPFFPRMLPVLSVLLVQISPSRGYIKPS
jgi:hypothetical protein